MPNGPDRHDTPKEMAAEERAIFMWAQELVERYKPGSFMPGLRDTAMEIIRAAVKAETERCAGLRPDEQYVGLPAIYWDEAVEAYAAKIREGEKDG